MVNAVNLSANDKAARYTIIFVVVFFVINTLMLFSGLGEKYTGIEGHSFKLCFNSIKIMVCLCILRQ